MAEIINGKEIAQRVRDNVKKEVIEQKQRGIIPKLAVILVGEDAASKIYVRNKSKSCEEVGIDFEESILAETITMGELLDKIEEYNKRDDIHGILLQSPIPKNLDIMEAFRAISPEKDVDGFHPFNIGKLTIGQDTFISCTPYGIIRMLHEENIKIEGKHAVILGRSNIVGKPLMQCLLNENATVTICHSKTTNLKEITKKADILIAAVGKPEFVTADMVKDGAIVIDVGINRTQDGKLKGDVAFAEVEKRASYITPVPGGVGPMTVAMLMENVVKAAEILNRKKL